MDDYYPKRYLFIVIGIGDFGDNLTLEFGHHKYNYDCIGTYNFDFYSCG